MVISKIRLENIRAILDWLAPGIELSVLRGLFAERLGESIELAEQRAIAFARQNECGFMYNPDTRFGTFSRAYAKT